MRKKTVRAIILFVSMVLMQMAFATVGAKHLKLAVGMALPPYFIAETKSGMEFEIIEEALKMYGHSIRPVFLPFVRVTAVMAEGKVDCASPINENSGVKAFYSDSHIAYQNFAISLAESDLRINNIDGLVDKSVIGFQNATKYLGPEFKAMTDRNSRYQEKYNQKMQTMYLYKRRVQVIVMDVNIFKYFKKRVAGFSNTARPIVYHEIFPKTNYNVAFRDKTIRDDFNKGLKEIRANTIYNQIVANYTR